MKTFIISALFLSTSVFSQVIDVLTYKSLMTAKLASLEVVTVGMSKKTTTMAKAYLETGECEYTTISTQSILKILSDRMIIHVKESFVPASTPICQEAGYEVYEESFLYYENKPAVADDLLELESVTDSIESIVQNGEIININFNYQSSDDDGNTYEDKVTMTYDLSKSLFRNLIHIQGEGYTTTSLDAVDLNPNSLDLKDILFCENNDGDNSECAKGDYSDILF